MRAFEVRLNGKRICVAGLELTGMDHGDLHFSVVCGENRQGRGPVALDMTGWAPTRETVLWLHRNLRMNDQVRIKIVEAKKADKYEVIQKVPKDTRKYEKAYVRAMAKEWGRTIQTGARKTRPG